MFLRFTCYYLNPLKCKHLFACLKQSCPVKKKTFCMYLGAYYIYFNAIYINLLLLNAMQCWCLAQRHLNNDNEGGKNASL